MTVTTRRKVDPARRRAFFRKWGGMAMAAALAMLLMFWGRLASEDFLRRMAGTWSGSVLLHTGEELPLRLDLGPKGDASAMLAEIQPRKTSAHDNRGAIGQVLGLGEAVVVKLDLEDFPPAPELARQELQLTLDREIEVLSGPVSIKGRQIGKARLTR